MNNKQSAGPDEISNQLLKPASPYIAGSLTYIFILCIERNVFPSEFQKAKVIPLPKTKDYKNLNDCRPVSLLSVLSKRLERHIHKHLVAYLETRNFFYPFQSGFRRKHSWHTASCRLTDSWLSAINRSDMSGDVVLDLKKAFDLVDHRILLSKLSVYLNSSNSLPFFPVNTLKIEYNVSLSMAPTRLKELLNMVYHKGQSWDMYSSASILMIYLCIYRHILRNVIYSRMTPHFIQQEKALCKLKKRCSFVLIVF